MTIARHLAFSLMGLALLCASAPSRAQSAPSSQAQPAETQPAQAAPSTQAYNLPPDKLAKAKTLNKIRLTLGIAGSVWGLAVLWLLLGTRAAAGLGAWAARLSRRRWIQGLAFFAAFFIITALAGLPLEMIGHIASLHYGISVQGWAGWFGDHGKSLALTLAFGCPVLLLFNWIVRVSPRRFWLWSWLIALPLMVLGTIGEPFLEPIFDKFEPLSAHHAALVADLQKVVARTGTHIPPDRMFLMQASAKTNGLNAYVTGLGTTKRIVVWDTTAGRIPDEQVMLIFGHETGHYVLHHIHKGLTLSAIGTFFLFWGCAHLAGWLAGHFGVRWGLVTPEMFAEPQPLLATRPGFLVLLFAVSMAGFILQPVSNAVSRYFEHQADVFGQEAIHSLVPDPQRTAVAAFNSLGEAWLEDPDPSPFVEFWLYDHPSTRDRANFAAGYNPWANGGHGKFFKQ